MTVFLLLLTLFACNNDAECSDDDTCGFGETCIEGSCQAKSCASSSQCDMQTYCSDGSCVAGCSADEDCYPGYSCDVENSQCTASACRSSTLDCDFNEFCNTATGECYEASGYYCMDCAEDNDCSGGNDDSENICLNWGIYGNFCGVACENDGDCPSGYGCYDISSEGQVFTKQCVTYCWLYITDDAKGPPPSPTSEIAPTPVSLQKSSNVAPKVLP